MYAAQGWTYPIPDDDDSSSATAAINEKKKKKKKKGGDTEGWNGERCRIRTVLVSSMSRQSKAKGESRYAVGETRAPKQQLTNEESGFCTSYDSGTTCVRRNFWNIENVPSTKAMQLQSTHGISNGNGNGNDNDNDNSTTWVPGKDSGWNILLCSDQKHVINVTVGPVIGRVTPTSVALLLEVAD